VTFRRHGPDKDPSMANGYLQTYLNDHLAAASSGEQLFNRVAGNQRRTAIAKDLARLAAAVSQDRRRLRVLMSRLDVAENKPKQLVTRTVEVAARLKPNRFVFRRSPLSDLLEVEALRVAVTAKRAGWRALLASSAAAEADVHDELADLMRRADEQVQVLEELHQEVAGNVLAGPG
jgi:hypothetical protein